MLLVENFNNHLSNLLIDKGISSKIKCILDLNLNIMI